MHQVEGPHREAHTGEDAGDGAAGLVEHVGIAERRDATPKEGPAEDDGRVEVLAIGHLAPGQVVRHHLLALRVELALEVVSTSRSPALLDQRVGLFYKVLGLELRRPDHLPDVLRVGCIELGGGVDADLVQDARAARVVVPRHIILAAVDHQPHRWLLLKRRRGLALAALRPGGDGRAGVATPPAALAHPWRWLAAGAARRAGGHRPSEVMGQLAILARRRG